MNWLAYIFMAWLAFAVFGAVLLYAAYGFVMSAIRDRDSKLSPGYVHEVDALLVIPAVLLDGMYNALILPVLCLDPRPHYAFKMMKVKGVTFPFFELVTERFSRYNEGATQWVYHRWIARTVAPFLDNKDPKGWHLRSAPKT